MNNELDILQKDLEVFEAMVAEVNDYLMSESTDWTMSRGDMPKLTLGGCLMRCHRLSAVRSSLPLELQARIEAACTRLQVAMSGDGKTIRFEHRAHQEMRLRLREWGRHLRDMSSRAMARPEQYASVVDTRVVIELLLQRLSQPQFRLDPDLKEELAALDKHLQGRWQPGSFVWPAVWQPAYPAGTYWWLYGQIKQA